MCIAVMCSHRGARNPPRYASFHLRLRSLTHHDVSFVAVVRFDLRRFYISRLQELNVTLATSTDSSSRFMRYSWGYSAIALEVRVCGTVLHGY